jgi:hypothetical protein
MCPETEFALTCSGTEPERLLGEALTEVRVRRQFAPQCRLARRGFFANEV